MMGGLPLALHHEGVAPGWAGVLVAVSAATVIAGQRLRPRRRRPGVPSRRMALGYLLLALGLVLAARGLGTPAGAASLLARRRLEPRRRVLLGEPFAVVAGLAPDATAAAISRRTA